METYATDHSGSYVSADATAPESDRARTLSSATGLAITASGGASTPTATGTG